MPTNQKTGFGLSGLSILLLVFFALPWTSVSCAGRPLFTQTGYQVIVGDATSPMAESGQQDPAAEQQSKKDDGGIAAWWLLVVPLGALAAGFAGFRHAKGNAGAAKLGAGASGVAAITLSLSLAVGLPIESKVQEAKDEMAKEQKKEQPGGEDEAFAEMGKEMGKAMGDLIVVERQNNAWYALLVTWAMLGVSVVMLRTSGPPKLE